MRHDLTSNHDSAAGIVTLGRNVLIHYSATGVFNQQIRCILKLYTSAENNSLVLSVSKLISEITISIST